MKGCSVRKITLNYFILEVNYRMFEPDIVKQLDMKIEDYRAIMIQYGAKISKDKMGCIFRNRESAQKALDNIESILLMKHLEDQNGDL